MLPAAHRMRRSAEFTAVVKNGRRARCGAIVVHHLAMIESPAESLAGAESSTSATVGLIVGRTVGGSVVRHRVSRRLRSQLAARIDRLPAGSATVVRALPPSSSATSAQLSADLEVALGRLVRPVRPVGLEAGR